MPKRKFSLKNLEVNPTSVGPHIQPISPAKARSANIALPPFLTLIDAALNVPGQSTPTEKPHKAMPKSAAKSSGAKTMSAYATTHPAPPKAITLNKFFLLLLFP